MWFGQNSKQLEIPALKFHPIWLLKIPAVPKLKIPAWPNSVSITIAFLILRLCGCENSHWFPSNWSTITNFPKPQPKHSRFPKSLHKEKHCHTHQTALLKVKRSVLQVHESHIQIMTMRIWVIRGLIHNQPSNNATWWFSPFSASFWVTLGRVDCFVQTPSSTRCLPSLLCSSFRLCLSTCLDVLWVIILLCCLHNVGQTMEDHCFMLPQELSGMSDENVLSHVKSHEATSNLHPKVRLT